MMGEFPETIREFRVMIGTAAARAGNVFERTVIENARPRPPATVELNVVAHGAEIYGFALAEALRIVEEHGDQGLTDELLGVIADICMNGDDGRCADIWPDIQAKLELGGVGTPQWDAAPAASAAPSGSQL
jgi:hypothetical protein